MMKGELGTNLRMDVGCLLPRLTVGQMHSFKASYTARRQRFGVGVCL